MKKQRFHETYKVGMILESILEDSPGVGTNPSVFLGYGTWTQFGPGLVLVGVNAADPDFNVASKTGGAKTVTLDVNSLPAHSHHQNTVNGVAGTANVFGALPTINTNGSVGVSGVYTELTGYGGAHNNVQPYVTAYRWLRTA
jgi:microcystin-dependent protein